MKNFKHSYVDPLAVSISSKFKVKKLTWVWDHEKSDSFGQVLHSLLNLFKRNGLDELVTVNPSRALKSTAWFSFDSSIWLIVSFMPELNGLEFAKYVAHPWRSVTVGDTVAFSFGYSYTDW